VRKDLTPPGELAACHLRQVVSGEVIGEKAEEG